MRKHTTPLGTVDARALLVDVHECLTAILRDVDHSAAWPSGVALGRIQGRSEMMLRRMDQVMGKPTTLGDDDA